MSEYIDTLKLQLIEKIKEIRITYVNKVCNGEFSHENLDNVEHDLNRIIKKIQELE